MRIIAVMSPKGGIGKTTTSDSIAYMLGEEQGKRVLVLDGDPQGDTSKTFGVFEPDGIGMSELLEKHECVGGTYKTGDLIRPTEYSHVDIIPANGYLMQTDMNLLLKSEDNQVTRLREALQEVSDAYDYCICDCGRLLDIPEKEDITAEEQETLNEQMRNQMMLLYEMEKDEIEVQEEQSRIIEKMEETE